jgi:hypothetical protein
LQELEHLGVGFVSLTEALQPRLRQSPSHDMLVQIRWQGQKMVAPLPN